MERVYLYLSLIANKFFSSVMKQLFISGIIILLVFLNIHR